MGEHQTVPMMAPSAARGSRVTIRIAAAAVVAALALAVYGFGATWNASMAYGGQSADGGWIDVHGARTGVPPTTIVVTGHPLLAVEVFVVVLALAAVVVPLVLGRAGRRRAAAWTTAGLLVAVPVVVALAIVVCTVIPSAQVRQAFRDEVAPPPMPVGVTVEVQTPA